MKKKNFYDKSFARWKSISFFKSNIPQQPDYAGIFRLTAGHFNRLEDFLSGRHWSTGEETKMLKQEQNQAYCSATHEFIV